MASSKRRSIVLSVITGPDKGKELSFRLGAVRIGRDATCEAAVNDSLISRMHGYVEVTDAAHVFIFSDRSRNGTYYVKAGTTTPHCTVLNSAQVMQPGDMLMLGHTTLRLEAGEEYELDAPPISPIPAAPPPPPAINVMPFGSAPNDTHASVLRIASTQAMSIYSHPFTQHALTAGRARRAAAAAAAAAAPPLLPTKRADTVAFVGDAVDPRAPVGKQLPPIKQRSAVRVDSIQEADHEEEDDASSDGDAHSFIDTEEEEDAEDDVVRGVSAAHAAAGRTEEAKISEGRGVPHVRSSNGSDPIAAGKRMLRGALAR